MFKLRLMTGAWGVSRPRAKSVVAFGVGGLLVVLLASCGASQVSHKAPPTVIKIGISKLSLFAAGYQMDSMLARENIKVEYELFPSTPSSLAALTTGAIGMVFGGFTAVVELDSQGQHIVFVSNAAEGGVQAVGATKLHITSLSGLKGKTVAIPTGTIQDMTALYGIKDVGLTQNQVNLVNTGFPEMPSALQAANVTAFVGAAPYNSIAIAAGYGTNIPLPAMPWGHLNSGLATTKSFLAQNTKLVRKVVAALVATTNRLEGNKRNLQNDWVNDFSVPRPAVQLLTTNLTLTTAVSTTDLKGLIAAEKAVGYITHIIPVSDVLDLQVGK